MRNDEKHPSRMERSELVEAVLMLRYERRLLGVARMTLDLVAAGDVSRWEHLRPEAERVAQMIVDEIGHPVTDEPALGPPIRELIDQWRSDPGAFPDGASDVLERIYDLLYGLTRPNSSAVDYA